MAEEERDRSGVNEKGGGTKKRDEVPDTERGLMLVFIRHGWSMLPCLPRTTYLHANEEVGRTVLPRVEEIKNTKH